MIVPILLLLIHTCIGRNSLRAQVLRDKILKCHQIHILLLLLPPTFSASSIFLVHFLHLIIGVRLLNFVEYFVEYFCFIIDGNILWFHIQNCVNCFVVIALNNSLVIILAARSSGPLTQGANPRLARLLPLERCCVRLQRLLLPHY